MARKHEHFGLSYLEELRMIKEREIICKESRRDFLKFKQAVAIAHTNVSSQPLLEDLTPDQSHQLEQYHLQRSESPHKPVININKTVPTEFIGSSEIARKVRISPEVRDMKKPINDLRMMMQTNTSVKEDSTYTNQKSYSEKITVENSSCSQESTNVKMPVIASLAGTTKKITMLKQPAPPRKPKYRKLTFHPRLVIYNPPILLQKVKDTRKMQGRAHSIKANVKNVETNKTKETSNDSKESDESSSTDSDSSEKASEKEKVIKKKDKKVYRELSKASQQDSVIEPEKAQSKRSRVSRSHPSVRSTSEQLEEARDITTPDTSKIYEENFQQSKPEELTSTPKLPVRVAARSIDEIIASLQSTFQSPSDQMIKELLESVLGQNYSIKMEVEESLSGTPGASLAFSEDMPDSVETEEYRLQLSSSDISLSQEPAFSVPKILEDIERKQESQITVKSPLEAVSSQLLQVRGEAILKAKPLEVQQKLSEKDLMLQQSLSSLSTWTPGFKGQHHSVIHHLCTASPNFALPADLQLASRVYHTFDRKGHYLLFTAEDLYHQEKASLCSEYIAFEEQMERNRICYEGVPVSELYQENQKDGINVLPPHTSGSLTEWQKIAEYYVEKPRLELLGEKVSVYPGTLKMFWAPAPPKFSAPLSFMKETLFPMYQSNVIEGVVVEDFSADLQDEDSESEDDLDIYSYMVSKSTLRRCKSSPDCDATEKLKQISFIQRSVSAPDMSAFNSKTAFTISADFKTSMKELTVMKKQISDSEVEPEIEKSSSTKQLLIESCNAPQSVLVDTPMERTPVLDMQVDTDDDLALAEIARKSGTKYIIFPKRKTTKKSKKMIDRGKLEAVAEELKQPSKILKSSVSLGRLHIENKFSIRVSPAVRHYRSPSLPCLLDFEKFAKSKDGIPKDLDVHEWVKEIWNNWFDEAFPPSRASTEEKDAKVLTDTKKEDSAEQEKPYLEVELTDLENSIFVEDIAAIEDLETEINRLTLLIEKEGKPSAFHYCRRGALKRKLGKLKSAMDDLENAISLEPLLLNAYWHRHLIYLFQEKNQAALDDLNFIIKWNKNNADAYLSKSEIYRKQGNKALAIMNCTLAVKCNPTDDDIYFRRAELLKEEEELLLAMDDYAKCFQYNPKRTDALMKHGIHFFDKSIWTVALQDFTAVIKEDPSNIQARMYRGRAYSKRQQYKNAVEDFSAAVHLDPSNWLAFYYRGCILRKVDPKRALQDFSVSVLLNDSFENLSSFIHRGILYTELCHWTFAICDFENALALDSGIALAYINIGLILLLHLENYYEAIRQFSKAIGIEPTNSRTYICRAQAYYKVHNLQNALRDINRAIHLYPTESHLCIMRGQYLIEMKEYKLASFCIYQVAEMGEVSFKTSPVQQALVQSFCQNHNEAIACLQELIANQPTPSIFVLLGKIQMKAKKTKDAVESFREALKILNSSAKKLPNTIEAAEIYYLMALCYMDQVSLLQAYKAFSLAVKVYPNFPDAFYQRGLCRMQLKQARCIQDFNRALAINPKHFQAYLSRAAYYGSKGRYSKAILNCNEAIKIHPDSVRAYLYRGTLKYHNKTYKNAIDDLTKTIDLDKICILAYYNRAICYHQIKDFKKALKDYGILLLLESSKEIVLAVLINRALLYVELEDYSNALEDFKEASLSDPRNSEIYQAIGICCHRLEQFEEAVNSFTQGLKLDPFFLDAYVARGNSYMEYGHETGNTKAQKDFLKAMHLNPKCVKARICLGYNLQAFGKFQKAWNQFTVAIDIDPKCHVAYDGRAVVCLQMGDTFAAFQDINAALKLTTSAQLLTNRGVINQFMGHLNCSMKDYQQAISINPGYALAYFNAANIYFHHRQFAQASSYYSKALQLDPRNESAVLNRAITNTLLQKIEEAKEDFEKAICLCPFSAAVYFNRANLYRTLKQYELAEKDISTALSIQPNDALMYKLRADVRGKMGFSEEAIADYKQAISIQEMIDAM
nr:tetratricopeptide repeat protein 6 isoform X1 [Pelodiscus sinensis]XP_025037744.1 tetratricopeptide repeat protein 6 isoform X1 [Pelodiscus sinensis]XP_025037745.1 tetratricopeptide repeat protein 6 isoform X2 [Pelodiscus sinensis]|eukprot:XP_025037743.1 tetratricopeptide repeat protein 6 isoform X1 [Pelodiscus sinensis]